MCMHRKGPWRACPITRTCGWTGRRAPRRRCCARAAPSGWPVPRRLRARRGRSTRRRPGARPPPRSGAPPRAPPAAPWSGSHAPWAQGQSHAASPQCPCGKNRSKVCVSGITLRSDHTAVKAAAHHHAAVPPAGPTSSTIKRLPRALGIGLVACSASNIAWQSPLRGFFWTAYDVLRNEDVCQRPSNIRSNAPCLDQYRSPWVLGRLHAVLPGCP